MDFLSGLFGDPVPTAVKLVILTVVLVAVLLLVFWVFRRFVGSPAIKAARGRQPRLAVTDAANLDDKRRLVLVRRDDVEHLVMIGGTSDILIETNIVRTKTAQPEPAPTPQPIEKQSQISQPTAEPSASTEAIAITAAAGAVAAASMSIETDNDPITTPDIAMLESEVPVVDELQIADIEATIDGDSPAVEFPQEEAIATPSVDLSQSNENLPDSVQSPVEDEITPEIEIEPDVLTDLENALGEELAEDTQDNLDHPVAQPAISDTPEISETEETPEVLAEPEIDIEAVEDEVADGSSPVATEETDQEKPGIEDEMQKLLDELSGEKK